MSLVTRVEAAHSLLIATKQSLSPGNIHFTDRGTTLLLLLQTLSVVEITDFEGVRRQSIKKQKKSNSKIRESESVEFVV